MGDNRANDVAAKDKQPKDEGVELVKQLFAKKVATTAGINAYYSITKNKQRDPDYKKVAEFCKQKEADPRPLIDWSFSNYYPRMPQSIRLLYPMLDRYIAAGKPDIEYDKFSILLSNWLDRMRRCKDNDEAKTYLLSPISGFSCFFQYCFAHKMGWQEELPKQTIDSAKMEIFLRPVYIAKFLDMIPEGDRQCS